MRSNNFNKYAGYPPDAVPADDYWTLAQLVNRRDNIVEEVTRVTNQLHEQLVHAYPTYKQFFTVIDRPTALFFWNTYPSPRHLDGVTVEQLAKELRAVSHNQYSTKRAQKILDLIATDGQTLRNYQNERDFITRNLVKVLEFQNNELTAIEKEIERMLVQFDFKLISIKGVNIVMAAKLLAEIGDINRFASADRLAESEYNEFLLKENEEVIFSFSIAESDEVLALCVSKEEPSYIVYGFGTSENVELEFPEDLVDSWDRFTYSYYLPGGSRENEGLDLNYLTFEYDGTEYEIFQEYSSENDATDVGIKITDLTTFEETILKASKDSIRGDLIELRGNDKIKLEVQ